MRKLQAIKKLFCLPWLLAGDTLLASYPDKYAHKPADFEQKRKARKQRQTAQRNKPQLDQNMVSKQQLMQLDQGAKLNFIFDRK